MGSDDQLELAQVRPGMRLAADVCGPGGVRLLGAGTVLTEAHINSLKLRGVVAVNVASETDAEEEAAKREAKVRERLQHLFRKLDGPAARELRRAVEAYRLGGKA